MDKPEHKQNVRVTHPGHKDKEVEIQGKNLRQKIGVQILGGSGASNGPTKIISQRGEE